MSRVGVIVHERLGNWARQLRPRLPAQHARVRETRSWPDLETATRGLTAPVVVLDLDRFGSVGLAHLDRLIDRSGDALVLVIDPTGTPERAQIARELGATHVITGAAPPTDVAALIQRWVAIARDRIERGGWHRPIEADPRREPWAWLAEFGVDPAPGEPSVPRKTRSSARVHEPSPTTTPSSRPESAT